MNNYGMIGILVMIQWLVNEVLFSDYLIVLMPSYYRLCRIVCIQEEYMLLVITSRTDWSLVFPCLATSSMYIYNTFHTGLLLFTTHMVLQISLLSQQSGISPILHVHDVMHSLGNVQDFVHRSSHNINLMCLTQECEVFIQSIECCVSNIIHVILCTDAIGG